MDRVFKSNPIRLIEQLAYPNGNSDHYEWSSFKEDGKDVIINALAGLQDDAKTVAIFLITPKNKKS